MKNSLKVKRLQKLYETSSNDQRCSIDKNEITLKITKGGMH